MVDLRIRLEKLERAMALPGSPAVVLYEGDDGRLVSDLFSSGGPGTPTATPAGWRPQMPDEPADAYVASLQATGLQVVVIEVMDASIPEPSTEPAVE
ncbi:hypothetical protein [Azohydromonas lata]|uniref:Uncharacterized protein n=1 Tax=Azohydromonas lata TaxID=45677 RepID=A0ABU5IFW0_9BURK|nr:hypothetical protein [Azohydromonas lata]MDZ5457882.1 hypothetical protein [Azohydromonas lata]